MTRVIALGSRTECDDDAALVAVESMELDAEVIVAGRPGPGLVDLLDPNVPTVLVDAVVAPGEPGTIVELSLEALFERLDAESSVSSHGLGCAEALRLAVALGRRLPRGRFVGIVAEQTKPGRGRSASVTSALPKLRDAVQRAIDGAIVPVVQIPDGVPTEARRLFEEFLAAESLDHATLGSMLTAHVADISALADGDAAPNLPLALTLAKLCRELLGEAGRRDDPEVARLVQAAVQYFIHDDDGDRDLTSPHGLDDDLAVCNAVAKAVGRDDLVKTAPSR